MTSSNGLSTVGTVDISPKPSDDPIIGQVYLINLPNVPPRRATILNVRLAKHGKEAYISYENSDKRLDTWIPISHIGDLVTSNLVEPKTPLHHIESNGLAQSSERHEAPPSAPSTPEREHAELTRVRNFEDVRFGDYLIKTWYYSPYPLPVEEKTELSVPSVLSSKKRKIDLIEGEVEKTEKNDKVHLGKSRSHGEVFASVGKGGEGARGRLWVCDYCFKYMKTKDGWYRHKASCDMLTPPGRKVYQRGSYTIWEVDGAQSPLYCQNLSLFGKLFIDHKSVFFHVENFLFYIICDASTSKHDLAMAFFSKEKISYDDFNLACIVTFPPCQNRGFGKLLIEFSYYLTQHPSTRSATESPGTPERPLSDLGLKGYTAYWVSTVLRVCKVLLADAPVSSLPEVVTPVKPGRTMRERRGSSALVEVSTITVEGTEMSRSTIPGHKDHYAVSCTLSDLAKAAHLRIDDTAFTLSELGFLKYRRITSSRYKKRRHTRSDEVEEEEGEGGEQVDEHDLGEWKDVEVVITRSMVDAQWKRWRVKDQGVLDVNCVLL